MADAPELHLREWFEVGDMVQVRLTRPPMDAESELVKRAILAFARALSPTPPGEVREKVARIVDPSQWHSQDTYRGIMAGVVATGGCAQSTVDDVAAGRVAGSLAKADAILALLSPSPAESGLRGGEGER